MLNLINFFLYEFIRKNISTDIADITDFFISYKVKKTRKSSYFCNYSKFRTEPKPTRFLHLKFQLIKHHQKSNLKIIQFDCKLFKEYFSKSSSHNINSFLFTYYVYEVVNDLKGSTEFISNV